MTGMLSMENHLNNGHVLVSVLMGNVLSCFKLKSGIKSNIDYIQHVRIEFQILFKKIVHRKCIMQYAVGNAPNAQLANSYCDTFSYTLIE